VLFIVVKPIFLVRAPMFKGKRQENPKKADAIGSAGPGSHPDA
jgi:hypothetical protein